MNDLWPQLYGLLSKAERPTRYINHEWGCTYKPDAAYRFCMIYPDTYELGQPNQAVRILCNAVNQCEGMAAERAFLPAPQMCDTLRSEHIPLFSLESCAPVREFASIGITLPHELAATNVLEILDLAGIPLHASDRTEADPFVFGGGPCALNPEPLAPFFDAFSIGEGEQSVPELLALHRRMREAGISRRAILEEMAKLPGCYVPQLYRVGGDGQSAMLPRALETTSRTSGTSDTTSRPSDISAHASGTSETTSRTVPLIKGIPETITRTIYKEFSGSSGWEPCIVPFAETVHDRLNVEILRGCTRGCRFCQAGMMYRPVRERSADNIVASVRCGLAETGYDEVSLTSLSSTDHSQIAEVLTRLNRDFEGRGVRVSIPSQRLDSFGVEMAGLVAGQKKGGLTFAPEAGTQRLRDAINKNVTENDLLSAVEAAFSAGWRRCKLYFMIGLPTETDDDVTGIAHLAERALDCAREATDPAQRGNVRITISCALFVPKPQTPFQWDGQIPAEEATRRVEIVRTSLRRKAIDVTWHDPATSEIEAALSRSGRDASALIEEAWKHGARFDAWTEFFDASAWSEAASATGFDIADAATKRLVPGEVLPWSHISAGIDGAYLVAERRRAETEEITPDCSGGVCTGCGACQTLEAHTVTYEVRHV